MNIVKRIISFVIIGTMAITFVLSANAEEERTISHNIAKWVACGYTSSDAERLIEAYEKGEPLTPFHEVNYDDYNSPADENGLGDDTLLLYGIIKEYVYTGDVIGFYLEQADGNRWLVACGVRNGVGKDITGNKNVFEELLGQEVEVYCKYMGYSEMFKLPTVDVTNYGGVLVLDDLTLIETWTAQYRMTWTGGIVIKNLGLLIGAKGSIRSYETPR